MQFRNFHTLGYLHTQIQDLPLKVPHPCLKRYQYQKVNRYNLLLILNASINRRQYEHDVWQL